MRSTIVLFLLFGLITAELMAGDRKGHKAPYGHSPDQLVLSLKPEEIKSPSAEPVISPCIAEEAKPHVDNRIGGIDVSHHNGVIDWAKVARDRRVTFCYIKATESSSFIDSRYAYNIREARRHGVKVGAYHFFSPTASPVVQMQNMFATVKLSEQDLIPIVDVEAVKRKTDLNAFRQRLKTFLNGVERHYGIRPLIYTGENFYNNILAGHFTEYKFMIAKYREPEPRIDDRNTEVILWQFTSTGSIDGIRGNCDQSIFLKDYNIKDILIK